MGSYGGSKASSVSGARNPSVTAPPSEYQLKQGESVFLRDTPNWMHPDGNIVIVKDSQGRYKMVDGTYSFNGRIDESSSEYKTALQSDNVKAKFMTDGTIEVTKGGLFNRKAKFKSVDAFQKEVNKRLDGKIDYYNKSAESVKNGYLPFGELSADKYKNLFKTRTTTDARREIRNDLEKTVKTYKTNSAAAQDMKSRLSKLCDDYRKRKQ